MKFNEETIKAFADDINAKYGVDLRCIQDYHHKIFIGEEEFIIVRDWSDAWEGLYCFKKGLETAMKMGDLGSDMKIVTGEIKA